MNLTDDITEIETEMDALAEAAERCSKIMILAKFAVAVGGTVLATMALGIVRSDALVLLSCVSAFLAGIAVYGSHRSTRDDLRTRIAAHEAQRNMMIDALDLPVVEHS